MASYRNIQYLADLVDALDELMCRAITAAWVEIRLRRQYPDAEERRYIREHELLDRKLELRGRVVSIVPWVWAAIFIGFMVFIITLVFLGD